VIVYEWLEERLEVQGLADDILAKYVPPHVNMFYCFGGIALTSFIVQVGSGLCITLYYRPSVIDSYASIQILIHSISLGWFIRSVHRWSSGFMVLSVIIHIARVYLTGGFKKPRELIWLTGVALAIVTVTFGVTGYSLPWDQVGYWACKITTAVPEAIDGLVEGGGHYLVQLIRGGSSVTQLTLSRFYSIHSFVLPSASLILMVMHFVMLRKQGISGPM